MKNVLAVTMLIKVMNLLPASYESVEGRLFRLISQSDVQELEATLKRPDINFGSYIGIPAIHQGTPCIANTPLINYALGQKGKNRISMIMALLQAGATFLPTLLRDEDTRTVLAEITTEQASKQENNVELHSFLGRSFVYSTAQPPCDAAVQAATQSLFIAIRNHGAVEVDDTVWSSNPDLYAIGYEGKTALELAQEKLKNGAQPVLASLLEKMKAQLTSREK